MADDLAEAPLEHLVPELRRDQQPLLRAPVLREHHAVAVRGRPLVHAALEQIDYLALQRVDLVGVKQHVGEELLDRAHIAHYREWEAGQAAE